MQVHLCSLSTELRPHWPKALATQPELYAYWSELTTKHNLRLHIVFNTHIVGAGWDVKQQLYCIRMQTTGSGEDHEVVESMVDAEVVISATGTLAQPRFLEDMEGMGVLKGEWFHSARWERDMELKGKKVGVVENGSSA